MRHGGIARLIDVFAMNIETDDVSIARRKLVIHDAAMIAGLSLATVLLFMATLFLFRSFESHRSELAIRWSSRGRVALAAGHPEQAIGALRTALTYAPANREYELLLAEALDKAGHTDESYNYFLGLWTAQPGDGAINLWLARLEAKRGDSAAAAKYYRASIYGTWNGDGAARRRDVRLELARYLLDHKDDDAARTELLIAGGNNPGDPALEMTLGALLEQANDPADAFAYYRKVIAAQPKNAPALAAAGRLAFAAARFKEARRLLGRADREFDDANTKEPEDLTELLKNVDRALAIAPFKTLPVRERAARTVAARETARKRFADCSLQVAQSGGSPSSLQVLSTAWAAKAANADERMLLRNPDAEDATIKLIFDTELQTMQACGPPSGDDALLLLLAQSPNALDQ